MLKLNVSEQKQTNICHSYLPSVEFKYCCRLMRYSSSSTLNTVVSDELHQGKKKKYKDYSLIYKLRFIYILVCIYIMKRIYVNENDLSLPTAYIFHF